MLEGGVRREGGSCDVPTKLLSLTTAVELGSGTALQRPA